MRRFREITAKRALVCLALLGAGGIASVIAGALGNSRPSPVVEPGLSAAEAVASRFPSAATEASAPLPWAALETRNDAQDQRLALFSPNPTYPSGWGLPRAASPDPTAAPNSAPAQRNASRPNALFNDAQIAAIRNRLNLTRGQEQYWPPVESALRDIAWQKAAKGQRATIDPNSRGVQRLKSAAAALVPSLNEEQKRELRLLAGLIGLQNVAAQF
jgi:hypothetical protein